jgi:hypothetical protein
MPMIIGVALFTLVFLVPRILRRWRTEEGRRERGLLIALGAGPFVLGAAVFAVVWALNPLHAVNGAEVAAAAGLVVGGAASIAAILFTTRWKPS